MSGFQFSLRYIEGIGCIETAHSRYSNFTSMRTKGPFKNAYAVHLFEHYNYGALQRIDQESTLLLILRGAVHICVGSHRCYWRVAWEKADDFRWHIRVVTVIRCVFCTESDGLPRFVLPGVCHVDTGYNELARPFADCPPEGPRHENDDGRQEVRRQTEKRQNESNPNLHEARQHFSELVKIVTNVTV